ncbi:MAG TPA: glycosyltransferase family 9 protein [Flavobacteriales bacterium]|nr:glycosyltransferase family 9 protein [Flavobacteriales bacterium]
MRDAIPYVLQDKNYGLGNFVNLTVAFPRLCELHDMPSIPVYFEAPTFAKAFQDCPFITILPERPQGPPKWSSSLVCKSNEEEDWRYVYRTTTHEEWDGQWTYVDTCPEYTVTNEGDDDGQGYTVLVNGAGNIAERYVTTKDPGPEYYEDVMDREPCVFVGSENDLKRNPWAEEIAYGIGDIRQTLAIIAGAKRVVANDTGLAHAAAAMKKDLTVLWVNTKLPRCKPIGNPRIVHV